MEESIDEQLSSKDFAGQSPQVAIPELFERHGRELHSLGRRICGSPDKADDLVQETFLRAFRKWHQFEGRSSPKTWLFSIAARICSRLNRRRAGEPARLEPLSELLPVGQRTIPQIPAVGNRPDELLLTDELRAVVDSAISKLPIHFRLPLVLKDLAELSVQEVASVLGLKEATVKTRVHRARLYLRKQIARKLPHKQAGEADHSRQVCLDLLKAKQEALDRGVDFPYADQELCDRCRSLFSTLDLTFNICGAIAGGRLPRQLREQVEKAFGEMA